MAVKSPSNRSGEPSGSSSADANSIQAMITRLQRLTDVMDIHRLGANEDPVD